ncbi:hypothetical protein J6590_033309 [Homalodisca vitripennis]|nr:hypothetical protein J6590_033309 [Homalodisca vitripennis]
MGTTVGTTVIVVKFPRNRKRPGFQNPNDQISRVELPMTLIRFSCRLTPLTRLPANKPTLASGSHWRSSELQVLHRVYNSRERNIR